ncbi:hypothetical protein Ancab_031026, partial [Ancistrocladus abbreviatus]
EVFKDNRPLIRSVKDGYNVCILAYGQTGSEIRSHHTNDGLSLPDATLHSVKSIVDVLNLMKHGDENRAVNFTAMNNQSSRSHSVLMVNVTRSTELHNFHLASRKVEEETFEAGSVARIVDCILALKSHHELKKINWGNGSNKHVKSPLVLHSESKNFSRGSNALSTEPCRCLDMLTRFSKESPEEYIVKALTDIMVNTKENIDNNCLASLLSRNQVLSVLVFINNYRKLLHWFGGRNYHETGFLPILIFDTFLQDPIKALSKILGSCLEEQLQHQPPELPSNFQDILREQTHAVVQSGSVSKGNRPAKDGTENIKSLLSQTKREFEDLQAQLFNDLKQLGSQVSVLGYQKVVQENRYLYNVVQDLKDEVFKDTRPLIWSVMDGYNFLVYNSEDLDFMQIENLKKALVSKETQNSQQLNNQPTTSPRKKEKVTTQRTPPRSRRLSIENSWSVMNTEKVQKAAMEATP